MSIPKKILSFIFLLLSVSSYSQAPSGTWGKWTMFFNQTRLHQKWSLHTEVQYRSYEILPGTEQLLLRGGINYHLKENSLITAGYGRILNYAFDKELLRGIQSSEDRTWQQLIMRNNIGRCYFEHRYRLEQRWIESKNNKQDLHRIRYFLRATIPLNHDKIEPKTAFLTLYNETFIHFTSTPFDRNRLYGALGYQFLPNLNMQLGYLAQTVNNSTRSYLQTAIFYNLNLNKS